MKYITLGPKFMSSPVWELPAHAVIVYLTLALVSKNGEYAGTFSQLSKRAHISESDTRDAVCSLVCKKLVKDVWRGTHSHPLALRVVDDSLFREPPAGADVIEVRV